MPASGERIEVLFPPAHLDALVVCAVVRRVDATEPTGALRSDVQANPCGCLNLVCNGSVRVVGRGPLPPLSAPWLRRLALRARAFAGR